MLRNCFDVFQLQRHETNETIFIHQNERRRNFKQNDGRSRELDFLQNT
jgi:hypothetical protein